jgi:hypothetical protein
MKLIAGALITAVLLSGCSQSRIDGEIQKNTTSATPSPQAEVTSPQDLFISKLNIDIKKELES